MYPDKLNAYGYNGYETTVEADGLTHIIRSELSSVGQTVIPNVRFREYRVINFPGVVHRLWLAYVPDLDNYFPIADRGTLDGVEYDGWPKIIRAWRQKHDKRYNGSDGESTRGRSPLRPGLSPDAKD